MDIGRRVQRHELLLIGLLLAIGLVLRLSFFSGVIGGDDVTHAYVGYFFFQPDEAQVAPLLDPSEDLTRLLGNWRSPQYNRIGLNLPVWLVLHTFGVHEFSVVLVPLIASLLGIVCVFGLLRRLHGPLAGLIGATLWACLPADIYTATVCLQDNLYATLLTLFLWLVLLAEKGRRVVLAAIAAGLVLGYMQFVKESAFLLFAPLGLWGVSQSIRARRIVWTVGLVFVGFLIVQLLAESLFANVRGEWGYYWTFTIDRILGLRRGMEPWQDHASILRQIGRYLFAQWSFGYGLVLLPVTAAVALLNRKTPLRLLLGLLCLAQFYITVEPMQWAWWTQRYLLQVAPLFIALTALGVATLLERYPRAPRPMLTGGVLAAMALLTALPLDERRQQLNRERCGVIRAAYAYLRQNVSSGEPIYASLAVRRLLYLYHGFQPFPGGFGGEDKAERARTGWVLKVHGGKRRAKRPYDVPPNWLEVYRVYQRPNQSWACLFRILPHVPRPRPFVLPPWFPLPAPDVSDLSFVPLALDAVPGDDAAFKMGAAKHVTVRREPDGLHCEVVGGDRSALRGSYGGVALAASAELAAVRFEITFAKWQNIKSIYVDGYDAQGERAVRWRGRLSVSPPPLGERVAYVLVPGEPSACFSPVLGGGRVAIERLALFLQVAPQEQAGFVLHGFEVAE